MHRKKTHSAKKEQSSPGLRGRLWIDGTEGTFLGYGRIILLERIQEHGSITQAAKSMKMSYRHAWELVDSMNRQSSKPLVEAATGGRNGGGAHLTKEGERAIVLFWELYTDFQTYLKLQQKKLACSGNRLQKERRTDMSKEKTRLVIASTTSTQNSGLFDILIPRYEKSSRYKVSVEVIAVGTGKALRIAKKGEADVLFVHDPFREEKFLAEGYGVNRRLVMHNDFVILGPGSDPAQIKGLKSAIDAFELIAEKKAVFVSRGDDSGTNVKELDIWDDAGVTPNGQEWYLEAVAKMGDTLLLADQKKAYVLSDRGTFLNYESRIRLKIMVESDPLLKNQYSVMAVSPAKFPSVRYREAMDFVAFVTSSEGQKIIASYVKHGVNLFYPDAIPVSEGKKKGR